MASILDKFAIKEVGDVTFYELGNGGKPTNPVLYLDTCKVTSMEVTSENTEVRGGKGNAVLMSFDFNKEINVNLEDALFSAKSMAIMFGNGSLKPYVSTSTLGSENYIMKTEVFAVEELTAETIPAQATAIASAAVVGGWNQAYTAPDGKLYLKRNPKFFDEDGVAVTTVAAWNAEEKLFCTYDIAVNGAVIEINADSFPKSYYVVLETYARMYGTGADDFFQLIFPSAKVLSENTVEMSSEGDPSTLNMSLKIQRPEDGSPMVSIVKYQLQDTGYTPDDDDTLEYGFVHNHDLGEAN